ncbi:ABC transporter permease [Sneathiella limimaris]|uniref:ABC transporter permease n=1 Tax=Sneathiella limimaris TaxID=1964213 RepID=UPI00146D605E|nr:ABC transporter permease subunit [Sneathiella limimaris]
MKKQKTLYAIILLIILGPFLPVLLSSLAFRWGWPDLMPSIWWWERRDQVSFPIAWDYILDPVSRVLPAIGNTILIAIMVTALSLLVSLPAARLIARHTFRGKKVIEVYLLTPLIVPEIALGIGMLVIFLQLGLHGSLVAVAIAHMIPVIPYMTRILITIYGEMDRGVLEQAGLLSQNKWQVYWYVELPLIAPGLFASALFSVLISSNIFLLTFYMGKGQIDTLATLLFSKLAGGGSLDAVAAGLTLLITLPGLVCLFFIQSRYRKKGFVGQSSGYK